MFQKIIIVLLINLISCKSNTEKVEKRNYSKFNSEALAFCAKKSYNVDYYILIDLSIHSGKNRFFVYNFKTGKNDFEKLVTHGSCDVFLDNKTQWEKASFSNVDGSHCSAKGKYLIGKRDVSKWGIKIKYWLQGLDKENSNSEKRVTVLHSWEAVSDKEIYPDYSPLSWGCPAVSNEFMTVLDEKLQKANKPVLLWIIE